MKLKFTGPKHLMLAVILILCAKIGFAMGTITLEGTHLGDIDPGVISDDRSDADTSVCFGNNLTVTLTSTSSSTKTWQTSVDNGITWVDVPSNEVSPLSLTHVTQDVLVRYIIQNPPSSELVSNNYYLIKVLTKPVINSLSPVDTCAGLTEYTIIPNITPGDGAITTYFWNGDADGSSHSTNTIPAYIYEICNHTYTYSLKVKDENGCVSSVVIGSFTTPIESSWSAAFTEVNAEFKPATSTYVVPDLQDTLEKAFNHDCNLIETYSQDPPAGTTMASNSTLTVTATFKTYCGNTYTPSIDVKSDGNTAITTADIEFDDTNDTITLYYGICDTLYYVNTPNYDVTSSSPYAKSDLTLTNDKGSVNEGTLLGRISGGEHTIIWTLTSPSGDFLNYPKKYIVMYSPCGDGVTVTDADGITYETVRIGCECWTKTNLKTKTGVKDTSYVYQNNPANEDKFGRLYTWNSVVGITKDGTAADIDTTTDPKSGLKYIQGICPTGWAIPTAAAYSNMAANAGGIDNIKSSDAWLANCAGTNASGFGAVGAGYRVDYEHYFYDLLVETFFWTCEGDPIIKKGTCSLIAHVCPELLIKTVETGMANSVRCVKRIND